MNDSSLLQILKAKLPWRVAAVSINQFQWSMLSFLYHPYNTLFQGYKMGALATNGLMLVKPDLQVTV